MSRAGYSEGLEPLELGRYRGRVMSAIRGRRGQAFLREMLAALDAMPEKRLIAEDLERQPEGLPFALKEEGGVCAMGSVGKARGIDMTALDPHEPDQIAATFGVAEVLAREIAFENDEGGSWWKETPEQRWWKETPEQRWARMRKWVAAQIKPQPPAPTCDDREGGRTHARTENNE